MVGPWFPSPNCVRIQSPKNTRSEPTLIVASFSRLPESARYREGQRNLLFCNTMCGSRHIGRSFGSRTGFWRFFEETARSGPNVVGFSGPIGIIRRLTTFGVCLSTPDTRCQDGAGLMPLTPPVVGELVAHAHRVLRQVQPDRVRGIAPERGSLAQFWASPERVRSALAIQGQSQQAYADGQAVQVLVHDEFLGMAAVTGLIEDGVFLNAGAALPTGPFVRMTVTSGAAPLAVFWFPVVEIAVPRRN